ncbi:MAG TPA: hypothetical protein VEX67_07120 [Solirubrobacteraceae bacterium]|nr:hypothetical protein [Solirubrobacteraceae bacterium]
MTLRGIITRTAPIALAAAALVAPSASARPAEAPTAERAGVEQHKQARRTTKASEFPTRPVLDRPSYPPNSWADAVPNAPADRGNTSATIGLGLAAGLLAAVAIAGIARRTRRSGRAGINAY